MATNDDITEKGLAEVAPIEYWDGILVSSRRRYLLYCLCLYANSMALPAIADQVTVWQDSELSAAYEQRRLWIYNSLYHEHLPVLRAAEVVDYHQENDLVTLGAQAAGLDSKIRSAFRDEVDDLLQAESQRMEYGTETRV